MLEGLVLVVLAYLLFITVMFVVIGVIKKVSHVKITALIYVLAVLSPILIYIPAEVNTLLHYDEFKDVSIGAGDSSDIAYFKVISLNDTEAKLFYVEGIDGKHSSGSYYFFERVNGKWIKSSSKTVWSHYGSASDVAFPPYY